MRSEAQGQVVDDGESGLEPPRVLAKQRHRPGDHHRQEDQRAQQRRPQAGPSHERHHVDGDDREHQVMRQGQRQRSVQASAGERLQHRGLYVAREVIVEATPRVVDVHERQALPAQRRGQRNVPLAVPNLARTRKSEAEEQPASCHHRQRACPPPGGSGRPSRSPSATDGPPQGAGRRCRPATS